MKKKVLKMGPKFGFHFSDKLPYKKGDLIEIIVTKNTTKYTFLTKFNRIVTIRKQVEKSLGLKHKDIVDIEINKANNLKRTKDIFYNNKIDLLALTPRKTSEGYEIIVNKFTKQDEKWLRLWYSHPRGSGRQLEIKRFVSIKKFGALLGQYQAEGTKESKKFRNYRLAFTNKLINEHFEFYNGFLSLGIKKKLIFGELKYNPNLIKKEVLELKNKNYEDCVTFIRWIKKSNNMKGDYGFETAISNTILWEIFNNSMNAIRKRLANKIETKEEKLLASSFLAKLLTGDGTLDSRTFNRNFPDVRIRIVDQNIKYLEDYRKILNKLGFFNPKINIKHIFVRTSCSFNNLLYLYNIKAFKNTGNWNKIIVSIALCLKGRRINTYYRFLELKDSDTISSLDIRRIYKVSMPAAREWLENKEKENLLTKIRFKPSPMLYKITKDGFKLISTLQFWQKDYNLLQTNKNIHNNPELLLSSLKYRNQKKIQPKRAPLDSNLFNLQTNSTSLRQLFQVLL